MKILAIDTTESSCSAALMIDQEILEQFDIVPRSHSEFILPMINSLFNEANVKINQLDAIAFSRGPGSFTGVRISSAVAQGLAIAAEIPTIPISSLLALAQGVYRIEAASNVFVGLDARMSEVYWATCRLNENKFMEFFSEEAVCAPDKINLPEDCHWCCAGSAIDEYSHIFMKNFKNHNLKECRNFSIHAQDIALLAKLELDKGNIIDPSNALPIYLRDNVAKKKDHK
tara:strand:- start:3788 stop:4474 length:687 start_codon:yes stop_codon:yes gene_type:complete